MTPTMPRQTFGKRQLDHLSVVRFGGSNCPCAVASAPHTCAAVTLMPLEFGDGSGNFILAAGTTTRFICPRYRRGRAR
jgi:hypothetical protein